MVNFPEHLNISPSITPKPFEILPDDTRADGIFGDAAQRQAIKRYGIAGRVWEAAYALCSYIHPPSNMEFDPPFAQRCQCTFLELGAGTGIVSCRIADIVGPEQDILIVTDLPEVCSLLENNIRHFFRETRHSDNVVVRPLAWGNEEHITLIASDLSIAGSDNPRTLTHVICSDLVYFPELLAPLLRTLLRLTSPPFSLPIMHDGPVTVLISYKIRSLPKETPFWTAFGLWFDYAPVLVMDKALERRWQRFGSPSLDGATFVFTAHRRPASFSWEVPSDDKDLLLGRGAKGNNAAKEDDTFEMLLLMTMSEI